MKLLVMHQESELYECVKTMCENSPMPCFRNLEVEYFQDINADLTGNYESYVQRTEANGPEWVEPDPNFLEKVAEADILMVEWGAVSRKVIDAGRNLKLFCTIRSAPESINVKYANSKGISVTILPSRLANAVADMTVGMMISECRGLLRRNLVYNKGEWISEKYNDYCHSALCNLKIGIVGYGGIGRIVAQRLVKGFECEVVAYEPITPESVIRSDGVEPIDLDTLCKTCDIITLHARLVPENEKLFGHKQFAMMKPNAIFINTARAGLVDEEALIEALMMHRIRGAGLDVYSVEPLPADSPLLKMDNVTLMPHSAGKTGAIFKDSVKLVSKELERFLTGKPLQFEVNKQQ